MGITGLLPLLKDITYDVHLRSFSGKVAAIDVYCWLHKTVIFCVEEIILGIETTRYVSTFRSYMCLREDVSKYRPEVYKSENTKILKKINNLALGKLLT